MSDVVIRSSHVSKSYSLHASTLKGTLTSLFERRAKKRTQSSHFWALQDISFDVKKGEVLAIIGPNGSGKSTLLKILSRVTAPTHGDVEVNGKISALLEIGAGFHPELSGRENIFMNGSILGLTREKIKSKFHSIIDFSGLESFIDMPLKNYSSGMFLRLGFAVAAHLEPEILLIDEALSLGDIQFQNKCFSKIQELITSGCTLIIVSHAFETVLRYANRCLYLDKGKCLALGPVQEVVGTYFNKFYPKKGQLIFEETSTLAQMIELSIKDTRGNTKEEFNWNEPIITEITFVIRQMTQPTSIAYSLEMLSGPTLISFHSSEKNQDKPKWLPPGKYKASLTLPSHLLHTGLYLVRIWFEGKDPQLSESGTAVTFSVKGPHRDLIQETPPAALQLQPTFRILCDSSVATNGHHQIL